MMKKYGILGQRIGSILHILESQGSVSIKTLSENFKVCEKTIRRDIERIDNPHIIIKKGHIIATQKTNTDVQSQVAMFILKSIARDLHGEIGTKALSLLDTLISPTAQPNHNIFFSKIMLDSIGLSAQELHTIQEAIAQKMMIVCDFHHHKRVLAPLKIVAFDGSWYCFALESTQNAKELKRVDSHIHKAQQIYCDMSHFMLKSFYLNDMKNIESTECAFVADNYALDKIDGAINAWFQPQGESIFVRLWVNKQVAKYFKRRQISSKQRLYEQKDGSLIIELHITHFLELSGEVLKWIPHVIVLEPQELRDFISAKIDEYVKYIQSL